MTEMTEMNKKKMEINFKGFLENSMKEMSSQIETGKMKYAEAETLLRTLCISSFLKQTFEEHENDFNNYLWTLKKEKLRDKTRQSKSINDELKGLHVSP